MSSWVDSVLTFFADQTKRVSTKLMLGVSILLLLWIIDNTFGFSYYYGTENKISQVSKIQVLLDNQKIDSSLKLQLKNLQNDVINRKSLKDYVVLSFKNIFATNSNVSQTIKPISAKPIRNDFLNKLSISGIYLLMIILSPILLFGLDEDFFKKVTFTIILILSSFGLAAMLITLSRMIPILFNSPVYNYLLNLLIQLFSFYLLYQLIGKNWKINIGIRK